MPDLLAPTHYLVTLESPHHTAAVVADLTSEAEAHVVAAVRNHRLADVPWLSVRVRPVALHADDVGADFSD